MQIEKGKLYVDPHGGPNGDQPTLYVGLSARKVMTSHEDFLETATIRAGADLSEWVEVDPDAVAAAALDGRLAGVHA